jgi:purine-binding chemotaxis protein CheW
VLNARELRAPLLVFAVGESRCALAVDAVERVVPAVEVTPLPSVPDIVLGVVDIGGEIVPVLDVRRRFGQLRRPLRLSDRLVIARTPGRKLALLVDSADGVFDGQGAVPSAAVLPNLEHLRGVAQMGDGLIVIHDLETFLSLEEQAALDRAVEGDRPCVT